MAAGKCWNCGLAYRKRAKFCVGCGSNLHSEKEPAPEASADTLDEKTIDELELEFDSESVSAEADAEADAEDAAAEKDGCESGAEAEEVEPPDPPAGIAAANPKSEPAPPSRPAAKAAFLIRVFQGNAEILLTEITEGKSLNVGARSDADIRIDDEHVSGRHARFELRAGKLYVSDLGSRNGTAIEIKSTKEVVPGEMVIIPGRRFSVEKKG